MQGNISYPAVLVLLVLASGCASPSAVSPSQLPAIAPTSEPTPLSTSIVQTPVAAAPPLTVGPVYQTMVPSKPVTTPTALPTTINEPTDTSAITFLHYSDPTFSVDYPSTWTVKQGISIRFTSASKRITFTAFVSDFLPGYSGDVRINPDFNWVIDRVSMEYPGYTARNLVYDYSQTFKDSIPVLEYSVRLPDGSNSYTRYTMVTVRHAYEFTFSADTPTFENNTQLRNYMYNTLVIHDSV